jgi:hypothetical protein
MNIGLKTLQGKNMSSPNRFSPSNGLKRTAQEVHMRSDVAYNRKPALSLVSIHKSTRRGSVQVSSVAIITVELCGAAEMDLEVPLCMKLDDLNELLLPYWGSTASVTRDASQFTYEKSVYGTWGIWWEMREGEQSLSEAGIRDGSRLRIIRKETLKN